MMILSLLVAIVALYVALYLQMENFSDHMKLHEIDNRTINNGIEADKGFAEWLSNNHEVCNDLHLRIADIERRLSYIEEPVEEDCTSGGF